MKYRKACITVFWGYCAIMFCLMLGRVRYDTSAGYWNTLSQHLVLTPFDTIRLFINALINDYGEVNRRIAIVNLLGNIVMFLPLGFFPPLLWKHFNKLWKTMLWSAAIIVCMELVQLFCLVGNCDIDDLLLNLVGVAVGYGISWLLFRRKQTENNP